MRILLFIDELHSNVVWIELGCLVFLGALMAWAPAMKKGWGRAAIRTLGSIMFGLVLLVGLFFQAISGSDPPRKHTWMRSPTGTRVALLSHSEFRDASSTQVTVSGKSWWKRYVAYDYYGDGDDYASEKSVRWLDDRHLVIQYALDPSGLQKCQSRAGDVEVICDPQPTPTFHNGLVGK